MRQATRRTGMKNWAGNREYEARRLHEPESVEAVQELVRASARIRALGSRHSFNDVADSDGDLLSLARLPRVLQIDAGGRTVTIHGGMRYGDVCGSLDEAGLALHNMASLAHISVAGACATGTHGSGARSASLSTAVRALEIVRADGELVTLERGREPDRWPGAVVALGSLGVVTRLSLEVERSYLVRQNVYESLPIAAFASSFGEIAAMAFSVSFFTYWRGSIIDQVWLKQRLDQAAPDDAPLQLHGAMPASVERHPIPGLSPLACTPQLGVPGPWHERLPHFRLEHTPSSGEELQSEYFVGREHAVEAFLALHGLRDRLAPLTQVSEIRSVAADELWLSPAYRRDSAAFHFTWRPDWPSVREVLPDIEAALEPFEPRPHWAKLFAMPPEAIHALRALA